MKLLIYSSLIGLLYCCESGKDTTSVSKNRSAASAAWTVSKDPTDENIEEVPGYLAHFLKEVSYVYDPAVDAFVVSADRGAVETELVEDPTVFVFVWYISVEQLRTFESMDHESQVAMLNSLALAAKARPNSDGSLELKVQLPQGSRESQIQLLFGLQRVR